MAREFLLPDIGEGLTEAEIVRWLVPEGGRVEADQPVVEVETDKAVVEIPSPYAGTVLRHGGVEGETIRVGSVLVVIGDDGEIATSTDSTSEREPTHAAPPIVGSLSEEAEVLSPVGAGERTKEVKALPIVRKLAREMGVDLGQVRGSGPEGRVTREDVLAAAPSATEAAAQAEESTPQEGTASPSEDSGEDERRPLSRLRRTIASNMARSWAEIPHVTTFDEVDATRLVEIRSALSARHEVKLPMEALVIKAVIPALEAFPDFNATLDGD
ncbi:MAG TPA: dihydrolipoamide acetyltransferase family protein, partial [Acidimicrobiia bacterium]|nr:dihydrolipoamide acetyltransferase family protein [Acidimicrobiia bacterium]